MMMMTQYSCLGALACSVAAERKASVLKSPQSLLVLQKFSQFQVSAFLGPHKFICWHVAQKRTWANLLASYPCMAF